MVSSIFFIKQGFTPNTSKWAKSSTHVRVTQVGVRPRNLKHYFRNKASSSYSQEKMESERNQEQLREKQCRLKSKKVSNDAPFQGTPYVVDTEYRRKIASGFSLFISFTGT